MKFIVNINEGRHKHDQPESAEVGDVIQCQCGRFLFYGYPPDWLQDDKPRWIEISNWEMRKMMRILRKRKKQAGK